MAGTLWYVRSDSLGADETIGTRLAQSFWNRLHERLEEPTTVAFVNRGVFLTLDDSPVLEALRQLTAEWVEQSSRAAPAWTTSRCATDWPSARWGRSPCCRN